jgi:flagellar hook protein FlgE
MSLTGALSSAISALSAQSQALAMVSDNIANSDTAGYKTTSALFEQMVTASNSARSYTSGGVAVLSRANITQQGLLAPSTNPADVAIQGGGFFVVDNAASGGTTFFTRNGSFTPDNQGMLQNDGFYLQGWRTNPDGSLQNGEDPSALTTINTQIAPVSASATTSVSIAANLPADATAATPPTALGTSSMTVYDSLGTPSTVQISWTKTGTNTWTATFGNPTSPSDPTVQTGTTTSGSVTLNFDPSTGALSSTNPSPPTLSIGTWSDGAADSTGTKAIALDFGGMTQFASGSDGTPTISNPTINPNGFAKGDLSGYSIGKNGIVSATYSNGQSVAIYKIAVATFADPNGLSGNSDGMFTATSTSGNATYQVSGEGSAGTVFGNALESSTTDTSGQFSNMITAQQAYSAASQVITTVNKMYDTLMSAMR